MRFLRRLLIGCCGWLFVLGMLAGSVLTLYAVATDELHYIREVSYIETRRNANLPFDGCPGTQHDCGRRIIGIQIWALHIFWSPDIDRLP